MRNKENSIYPHVKPNCRLGQTRWWMDGQTDKPTGERTDGRMDKLTAWMHGQLERGCHRGWRRNPTVQRQHHGTTTSNVDKLKLQNGACLSILGRSHRPTKIGWTANNGPEPELQAGASPAHICVFIQANTWVAQEQGTNTKKKRIYIHI